ncbi:MAG: hypothetical protein GF403_08015 [Candidatus Coatesbacteria bacterium]|nr:hypothetical protein [Candidatus Coatesbacteria bacterium]
MAELHLLVGLKTPDTVAVSAELALRDLMGHEELVGLRREEYWHFGGDFDTAGLLDSLLLETSRFVNPAKHLHRTPPALEPPPEKNPSPGRRVGVLVRKRDDFIGRDALVYCRRTLGLGSIATLEYATLWTLTLDCAEPRAAAREIADCRARRAGLLANPQCETFELVDAQES